MRKYLINLFDNYKFLYVFNIIFIDIDILLSFKNLNDLLGFIGILFFIIILSLLANKKFLGKESYIPIFGFIIYSLLFMTVIFSINLDNLMSYLNNDSFILNLLERIPDLYSYIFLFFYLSVPFFSHIPIFCKLLRKKKIQVN
ncbi:hypothetical protein [Gallibacterium sp. ZY190522]